jgi:hypothetical protein
MPNGLGETGIFKPAESAYARPGTFEKSLEAEALKQARYLSHMDEVAKNLEAAEERLEMELEVRREDIASRARIAEKTLALRGQELEQSKSYQEGLLRLGEEKLDVADPFRDLHPAQRAEIYRRGREPAPTAEPAKEWTPAEELAYLRELMPIIDPVKAPGTPLSEEGKARLREESPYLRAIGQPGLGYTGGK